MSDFDRCFESAFLGNRQAVILHKYHLGGEVWHICTVDSNNYYHSGYYRRDPQEWTFAALAERPSEQELQADGWPCPDCGRVYHGDTCPGCGFGEAEALYRERMEEGW